ncbi:hypothetical protein OAG27_05560 [Flavobacteriaceae bacterium]|nr:hypothetical protein [Flavobacteriaceae bacterium]
MKTFIMFKLNFISEPNQKKYYNIVKNFPADDYPDEEDGGEWLDLNEYLSEGDDAEKVISWITEFDFDTKIITISGEIEEEYEDWGYSFDVYDIEQALRSITDKFNITWKVSSLLDEDGEEQW